MGHLSRTRNLLVPPFPFQIVQSQRDIAFAYEYATSNRVVNMGKFQPESVDTWMGTSNGHWEGDTTTRRSIPGRGRSTRRFTAARQRTRS
ncbi:MAG TPA: hypothetical protein VH639_22005 [Bryobacteraceae bacterium]|jgi:hypothetical protein